MESRERTGASYIAWWCISKPKPPGSRQPKQNSRSIQVSWGKDVEAHPPPNPPSMRSTWPSSLRPAPPLYGGTKAWQGALPPRAPTTPKFNLNKSSERSISKQPSQISPQAPFSPDCRLTKPLPLASAGVATVWKRRPSANVPSHPGGPRAIPGARAKKVRGIALRLQVALPVPIPSSRVLSRRTEKGRESLELTCAEQASGPVSVPREGPSYTASWFLAAPGSRSLPALCPL